MNNLFAYASKELSTDAFLAWLFRSLSVDPLFEGKSGDFFRGVGLCEGADNSISGILPVRQEGNTDLIVRCNIDGRPAMFLFENKRHSSMRFGQLDTYKERFPDCDRYIYLKLGFINYQERKIAEGSGYKVLGSEELLQALNSLADCHFLVVHYIEYLHKFFVDPQRKIRNSLCAASFSSSQAQQYFLSSLHQSLSDILPSLKFSSSANIDGSPWTQLTIANRSSAYADKSESLFWRIDKRGKGYYLRLTQYSNIGQEFKGTKKANLRLLRKLLSDIPLLKYFMQGKVRNDGVKSSEVLVFFFVDNDIANMAQQLPALTIEIAKRYRSSKSWVGVVSEVSV
jgi:hypothetical protein